MVVITAQSEAPGSHCAAAPTAAAPAVGKVSNHRIAESSLRLARDLPDCYKPPSYWLRAAKVKKLAKGRGVSPTCLPHTSGLRLDARL